MTLGSAPGIHRYRWDLVFDAEPVTDAQVARVSEAFQRAISEIPFPQIQWAYTRFQEAATPREQRDAVQVLLSPPFASGLGAEHGTPTAGPGSYLLTMTVDGIAYTSTLTLRPDPLLTNSQ